MQSGSNPQASAPQVWNPGGMFSNPSGMCGGLAGILGGLFGNSGNPYSSAMNQFQKYMNQGIGAQQPFYNAGVGGMQNYQNWLNTMKNPTGFINNMMNQYQASPYSQYLQQQNIRAGNNAASAAGLTGSTPFAQQLQQNATNISSQDMNQWLQNVLGVNQQYGAGEQNLMNVGQNAANAMSNMYGQMGQGMAGMAYGQGAAQNNDFMNELMGGLGVLGSL